MSFIRSPIRLTGVAVLLATSIFFGGGCRTTSHLATAFAPALNQTQPCSLENISPGLVDQIVKHQKGVVEHLTTGGSAIPSQSQTKLCETLKAGELNTTQKALDEDSEIVVARLPASMRADIAAEQVSESLQSLGPLTSQSNPSNEKFELSLNDAIQLALSNSTVIRSDADFVSGSSQLLSAPDGIHSADDVWIRRTGYLFGQRGEAAALSDFDTQFNWTTLWNRNETVQNNTFLSGGILPGGVLVEDTANFRMELARNLRSGGRAGIVQTWDYSLSNRDDLLFPSAYAGNLAAEFRQPVLAGAGRVFTDVAGPPGEFIRGIAGVSQGVLIARTETEIAEIDLRLAATNFLADVEAVYCQFSSAQQSVQKAEQGLSQIKEFDEIIRARLAAGAQADDLDRITIEELINQAEQLLTDAILQRDELNDRLGRLLGFSQAIQPQFIATEVVNATRVTPDLDSLTKLALSVRGELDRQHQRIRTIDLQIRAAQSLLLPQLDVIARYQLNGFGDHLISEPMPGPDEDLQSAYHNLFQNDNTSWQLGFQFSHNLGRRLERARLENLRAQSRKAKVILHQQRHEIEHEVAFAVRRVEAEERNVAIATRRVRLLEERVDAIRTRYEANDIETDVTRIAEADFSIVQAQIQLDSVVGRYAESLVRMKQSVGRTLDENGIRIVGQ